MSVLDGAITNLSGTIAVTNTFQSIQAKNPARSGGVIQNNGANNMWLFLGPIASATKATSIVLAAGAAFSLNSANVTLVDELSITGTATDTFFAGIV